MERILRGLEILFKYYPSADFASEHDQIWVYSWTEKTEVSKENKKKLDGLGWFIDEEDDTWSHFC